MHVFCASQIPEGEPPQAVPGVLAASVAGHVAPEPVHVSATSHAPTDGRHSYVLGRNVQLAVQHAPPSHCSPVSTVPLPHTAVTTLQSSAVEPMPHATKTRPSVRSEAVWYVRPYVSVHAADQLFVVGS